MTKKFDFLVKNLLENMEVVDVTGPNSGDKPYDTSDGRTPKILGKIRKRKLHKEDTCVNCGIPWEETKDFKNVTIPSDLRDAMNQCSLGKNKDGYFVYTHRAKSKSYKTPHDIPKSKIDFINSTY